MTTSKKFSREIRGRAVRMVFEHQGKHESQWVAICSISVAEIGRSADTLRNWVRRAERDQGQHPGLTSEQQERLKALERVNRELRRANEILRKASAYFAWAISALRPAGRKQLNDTISILQRSVSGWR